MSDRPSAGIDWNEIERRALEAERDYLRESRDFWKAQYDRVRADLERASAAMLQRGIESARAGKIVDGPRFSEHADDDLSEVSE